MEFLSMIGSAMKWTLGSAFVLGLIAAATKPSNKALEEYAAQWSSNRLGRKALNAVNLGNLLYQDMIVFRVAQDDENKFVGFFGAWFKI